MTAFDETAGTFEGRAFPGEAEWLDLPVPPITADFVERTIAALSGEGLAGRADSALRATNGEDRLTPAVLAAFAAPAPSRDFVQRTLHAVQEQRRSRWQELLARHVAPDPSPDFVARTLAALARRDEQGDPHAAIRKHPLRLWIWPLLTIAAAAAVFLLLQRAPQPPIELRLAQQVRPAFAHAYASSPLPAVLAELDRRADPSAMPNGGADGIWLLQRRDR